MIVARNSCICISSQKILFTNQIDFALKTLLFANSAFILDFTYTNGINFIQIINN